MKIDPTIHAPNQTTSATTTKTTTDFATLLAQQLAAPTTAETPAVPPSVLGVQAALLQQTERTVMEQITGLMDAWDTYAASVDQADLKRGHTILGTIRQRLTAVHDTVASTPGFDERLRAVVEEMEVLGAAEEIKLRRGDYLES